MTKTQVFGLEDAIANLDKWGWGTDPMLSIEDDFSAIVKDAVAKIKKALPNEEALYRHGAKVAIEQMAEDLQRGYLYVRCNTDHRLAADMYIIGEEITAMFNLHDDIDHLISELSNESSHDEEARLDAISLAADFRKWAQTLEDATVK